LKKKRFSLSKAERISRSQDFKRVFIKGKRYRFPEFTLVVAPNDLSFSRIGIGVGRRFGKAVLRNRAKRLCRELFRLNKDSLPKGVDIIFLPRQQLLNSSWQRLQERMAEVGGIIERKIGSHKRSVKTIGLTTRGLD